MTASRCVVYFSTLSATMTLVGIIGAYSVIKSHINTEFGIGEDSLGIIDGFTFLGRFCGTLYLSIWPSKNPKLTYFLTSLAISTFMGCIPIINLAPDYAKEILIVIFLFKGFGSAIILIPIYLVNEYFNPNSKRDQVFIGIWMASMGVGDLVGLSIVHSFI